MDRGGKGKWWKFERLVQSFNGIICGNFLRTNLSPKNWITKSLVGPIIVHHKFHIYCQSVTDYNFISTVGWYWLYHINWRDYLHTILISSLFDFFFTTVYKRKRVKIWFSVTQICNVWKEKPYQTSVFLFLFENCSSLNL